MKRIKGRNKITKPTCLLLLLFFGLNLFSQYSIKEEGSVLTKKELESLQKAIDFQLEFYNKAFPDSMMEKSSVNLSIYNNYMNYLVYQDEQFGYNRHRSMGFYSPKNNEAVVCKDKNEKDFLKTCYHELSHFFIRNYMNTPPAWLDEGLATYFGNMKISKSAKHELNIYLIARVKTMIELKDIVDLKDFIDWNYEKFYDISFSQDFYGYALAYCIVYFLMQNEETMIAVINHIYKGKSSYEALENSYNGGFAAFERDFIQKYSHIIPVFHTLNAGDVKLEENTTYVGGEINKHLLTQDGFDLFSQHSIKDEESVLTKKENQILQKVIDYQLEFYNRAFPDSTIKKSSVKLTVFNNRNDYIDYVAYNEGKNREDVQSTAGFYSTKNKEVRIF